jgi:cobalt/nickel transport system permease protein
MHMADALLSPTVAGTMYGAASAAAAGAVMKLRKQPEAVKVAEVGVMGAFVFAAQMVNFAVPGTGSSGHICGGVLLSAILGPSAAFLTLAGVLLVQCLFFADGGILALGANVWNMGFYGCMIGGGVVWPLMVGDNFSRGRIYAASIVANIVALHLGALTVTLQTLASGVTELPFSAFLLAMQPIHLAIGFVEGVITASVLTFIAGARRDMLYGAVSPSARFSRKAMLLAMSAAALLTAGFLSLAASSSPDGLEWSIERVAGTAELERSGAVYSAAGEAAERAAIFPDYNLPGSESVFGAGAAGIVGTLAVFLLCAVGLMAVKFGRKCNR